MKDSLQVGFTATRRITVDKPRTIDFLGEALRVYGTPELVRDFEYVCRDALLEYADSGEDSVGTGITVSHGGATLLGMGVEIAATVTEVDGRQVSFDLVARDDMEEISRGKHTRFVIDVEKMRSRVAAKAEKVRA